MASDDLSLLSLEDESSRRRSATAADFDDDNEKSLSDSWVKVSAASTIEAQKRQNNQLFGFKKWKSHVTRRPLAVRSDVVKELYSEPKIVKQEVSEENRRGRSCAV
ncbi:uncharacterized protein LOC134177020 isoform X2 [Corticium candelabrum]|uniref:uncharacterized protein LOC134177020 isoform X2 n=1 Tax=Corticium candelabrum TaxID=121492 RepID=UPI002E26B4C8|nr:uncharacterized protein LOC134177020 isoform X2 [Corticium candelabrum]